MVAAKSKPIVRANQEAEDRITRRSVGTKNLKVYSENVTTCSGTGPSGKGIPKPAARKVLSDVSNLQPSFSRREVHSGLKPVVSIGPGSRNINAAAKKGSMGKVKGNLSEGFGNYCTSKKGTQGVKVPSSDEKAKGQGSASASIGRMVAKGSIMQTRKSLPVLKRVDRANSSDGNAASSKVFMRKVKVKPSEGVDNYHKLKKVAGTQGVKVFSGDGRAKGQGHSSISIGRVAAKNHLMQTRKSLTVCKRVDKGDSSIRYKKISEKVKGNNKASGGQKVAPQISQTRSHLWRHRASDGFIAMAPKGQRNVGSHILPKKSVRPIVKILTGVRDAQWSSNSRSISCSNKLLNAATKSSKGLEEAVISTLPEAATSIVVNKTTQGDLPCGDNSDLCMKASEVIVRRKSCRRRSFTASLVTGLKNLEKDAKKMQQKELSSIDNSSNQLEVAEYVDEIYQHYWVTEAENPCLADYMNVQSNITPQMRGILINWLIEVNYKFDLMPETLYLTVALLDRYLSLGAIKKNEMQLVGLTALLIASKYEDFWHPRVKDLISISAESYTRDQLLGMEKLILNKLKFRLNLPTLYVFMLRFLKAAQGDTKLEHLAFFLIELCLVEYEALKYKPSMLCAAAIYVARCTLQLTPTWTPLLNRHARYDESQIRDCAAMILNFHKAAKTGMLNVTHDKYLRPELGGVATIKPLNRI